MKRYRCIVIECRDSDTDKCEYLEKYGCHFSEKACQWAVNRMQRKDAYDKPVNITHKTMAELSEMAKKYSIKLDSDNRYDALYLANMVMADLWGSSIEDEAHMAKYIRDVLEDPDRVDGHVFRHWVADMEADGDAEIDWKQII